MPPRKFSGMRNREAARYARWSAGVAVAICLLVAGIFLQRRMHFGSREKNLPPVPAAVAQQSAGFAISRVVGTQTIFTVHASQETQFINENRSLLENVQIEIYGSRGDRNDSVHADECSYEPDTGSIRCQGVVKIDLRNAKAGAQKTGLHLETSDILFDHDSGRVSTDKSVALKFAGGEGKATGVEYAPQSEDVMLKQDVQLTIVPRQKTNAIPVNVSSRSLEFRRSENILRLIGPVRIQQAARTLTAGALDVQLDAAMQPSRIVATQKPEIDVTGARGKAQFAAAEMTAILSSGGAIEKISADENIRAESSGRIGENHFSAQHAQVLMDNTLGLNEPREILAQGNVQAETAQRGSDGNLETESLRVELSPRERGHGARVASAETLSPGKMKLVKSNESDQIEGGKLSAIFGAQNQLSELRGGSGVHIARKLASAPMQASTAENLLVKFGTDGNWQTIDESGNVKFSQGDRSGAANTAQLSRATNEVTLAGAATVADSSSHLQASRIWMNQATGEMRASGSVVESFTGGSKNVAANPAAGDAQISADEMSGISVSKTSNTKSPIAGHAIFSGHARLWQGSDVLQAQAIEFWQSEKRAEARGDVLGEFMEAPHKGLANLKQSEKESAPVLWQVRGPKVNYWSDSGKMEWSGGVKAQSSEGTMASQTLDLSFARAANQQRTLDSAIATGQVRIQQNGRTGTAERGEYFAREGKFILSGGQPTLADASGNTTTGHELIFFLANDSVVVDSRNESQGITTHPPKHLNHRNGDY